MEAQGCIMTNKYAEGYPGKRYYGGCHHVDVVEQLAIDRAKELFGAEHANVQPHSGSQANMAVYFAACKPGDTILGMNLSHGGHLTHGSPVNFSGKLFNIVPYGVSPESQTIDYAEVERLAEQHRPKMIVVGASAYPRIIDFPAFRTIADKVGALHRSLVPFRRHRINMTKIESRPSKRKAWEYFFFIDCDGHIEDAKLTKAIRELEPHCNFVKVLGSFPNTE